MHIVLGRDGTVLAANDGAPAPWVGARLDGRGDAPKDLQIAARDFLARVSNQPGPLSQRTQVPSIGENVEFTVVDAMYLHRLPTDVREMVRTSLDALQRQAIAAGVTLSVVVDSGVPQRVSLDPERIAWAITALVGNALRYVRRGSISMPSGSVTVHVAYNAAGPEITIDVQDDGPGIPADRLPNLFSDGPDGSRFGLGLLMVRDIAAAHGGRVDVQSETAAFASGTTIRLTLPVW
jgi:signal transduction histidine kinase